MRTVRHGILALLVLLALATLLLPGDDVRPVAAQGGETLPAGVTWDEVNEIAHQMYCDVCEGIPLDECESVACRNWRQEIGRLLSIGYTENEIIDHFVERYGTDVASLPRGTSDRWLVFAVPILIALVVGVVGFMQVRQLRQRGQQPGDVTRRSSGRAYRRERPMPDEIDPAFLDRLQHELENLEL